MKVMMNGYEVEFEQAVNMMDDEIREDLSSSMAGECTEQEFLDAYMAAHLEKYGEEFQI